MVDDADRGAICCEGPQTGARDNPILLEAKVDTLNTKLAFAEAEMKEQEKHFAEEYEIWGTKHGRLQAKHDECAALPS